ncbi:MAG TPA: hypothetical protein VEK73_11250 [Xanthobacteraceae bacterium]|nr:hypothetical protein [Xanthobacteraceae bacterium]
MKRVPVPALAIALGALVIPVAAAAQAPVASANPFGQCACHHSLDIKMAACTEAAKATSYPWILHWVYRELARAQRERGDTGAAVASYARSLAAKEDDAVRMEMESLAPLTQ